MRAAAKMARNNGPDDVEPLKPSRAPKRTVLVLSLMLSGLGIRACVGSGSSCPDMTSQWVTMGLPQTYSDDYAIAKFVSSEQPLGVDVEGWAEELECKGEAQLLGRVLAEARKNENAGILGSIFVGTVKGSPKASGPIAAANLEEIFSSEAAQNSFSKPVVDKFINGVRDNSADLQTALYEILNDGLPEIPSRNFEFKVIMAEAMGDISKQYRTRRPNP
jgi:hypothetical protein